MRFSVAYYLILLYLTVTLKPLMPLVSDAWSHAFAEANHIASVHAKYGANHVEKELASGEQNDNNKNQDTTKTSEPLPVHLAAQENAQKIFTAAVANQYPVLASNIPALPVPASPGQPPKFLL